MSDPTPDQEKAAEQQATEKAREAVQREWDRLHGNARGGRFMDGWFARWFRYGWCPFCSALVGEPCVDRMSARAAYGRRERWCRHPHPERRSLRTLGLA